MMDDAGIRGYCETAAMHGDGTAKRVLEFIGMREAT